MNQDLTDAGHRVRTIRIVDGSMVVVMQPGATEQERVAAQAAAEAWTPSADAGELIAEARLRAAGVDPWRWAVAKGALAGLGAGGDAFAKAILTREVAKGDAALAGR